MSKALSRQTSINRAPLGTWNSLPLMVTLITSVDIKIVLCHELVRLRAAVHSNQMFFKVFRKTLYRRLNRPRCGIAQRTKRLALDVVTEVKQQLRVFRSATAARNAFEN